jgi:hypothetical protein
MSIPANAETLLLASQEAGGYQVSRSLRFNGTADSSYLSRTPASSGDRKKWTWSGWVKRSNTTGDQWVFSARSSTPEDTSLLFDSNGSLVVFTRISGTNRYIYSNAVFRDFSAWMHVVCTFDTTQATDSNRVKLYVNGTQLTYSSASYPPQNADGTINNTEPHNIGNQPGASQYFNGCMADIWFLDGIATDPSSFAETDATTGQWIPKTYSGSKGSNGFHLEFADNSAATAAALGKDTAGSNNWTPNNFSVLDGTTSVAAATGGLPIYNTTGTYGTTKGTGTRTDSNSSSIVLAVPMDGANNGTTFTDESATIKGSGSAKSITRTNAVTSTAQSKYYGSSGSFSGSGAQLTVANSTDFDLLGGDYTIELWAYTTTSASVQGLVVRGSYGANNGFGVFNTGNELRLYYGQSELSAGANSLATNVWQHVAVVQSSGSQKLFVNGTLKATGSMSRSDNNSNLDIGHSATAFGAVYPFSGYIQDVRIYKGVAKYSSNFNPPTITANPTTAAGNDSLVDTPTSVSATDTGIGGEIRGNYCTLNPLSSTGTMSNGNLDSATNAKTNYGTIAYPTTGKWYWECTLGGGAVNVGLAAYRTNAAQVYLIDDSCLYSAAGLKNVDGVLNVAFGSASGSGDIIGIAANADTSTVEFFKNGVSMGTISHGVGGRFPVIGDGNVSQTATANFGQRPFAYTAPSGFKALCTTNLPAPVVTKPSSVFDVKLYTGTGSSQSITGLGFSPDLVVIKRRSAAENWTWTDTVRGATKTIYSNLTNAEGTDSQGLTAFNSDGFTVGTDTAYNASSSTYAGFAWDAGSSTVTNTQGSITSSVRANTTAGFSVVTWTGTGSGTYTVGHGLGVAPSFIITKFRGASSSWECYHASLGNAYTILLESTSAALNRPNRWNSTSPTSSVFTIGTDINDAVTCVGYCFAPVAGYSAMGSYTGNGSRGGPFVYTGFRPRWLMTKRTDSSTSGDWNLVDTARGTYNVVGPYLYANQSAAEGNAAIYDILSNGFKIRESGAGTNANGSTYIYAAFAESPFNYARAR